MTLLTILGNPFLIKSWFANITMASLPISKESSKFLIIFHLLDWECKSFWPIYHQGPSNLPPHLIAHEISLLVYVREN